MITYPNQKVIHINKSESNNFLQVDKGAWMQAGKELTYGTFKLYLYLAGNQDGFDLALSPAAVEESIGLSESSYRRAVKKLIKQGYIISKQGNIYDFNVFPSVEHVEEETKQDEGQDKTDLSYCSTDETLSQVNTLSVHSRTDNPSMDEQNILSSETREINIIDKRDILYINESDNKLSSEAATQPKTERFSLEELETNQLKELLSDFRKGKDKGFTYNKLYVKYNLVNGELDKNLHMKIERILEGKKKASKKLSIKKMLDPEQMAKLMKYTNTKDEEELLELLSGIKVEFEPYELILFLDDNPVFSYEEWEKDDDYVDYYKHFAGGVDMNYETFLKDCDVYFEEEEWKPDEFFPASWTGTLDSLNDYN